jgi:hypothetical protein
VRGTWIIPAVVSACGFSPLNADGARPIDAPDATMFMDAPPDAPPDEVCFGTLTYDTVCYKKSVPLPTNTRNVNGDMTLHSDDVTLCDQNALGVTGVCVISADKMIITGGSALRITGMQPVIILATGTGGINLNAASLLDLGSTSAPAAGAGALATCAGATAASALGGGFGGSFVASGGMGGNDSNGAGKGLPATVLGTPATLHGGCPGGAGSSPNANQDAAAGNAGGGVVLIAQVITIDGAIVADGGGGKGTNVDGAGGGGGGAGGLVVLDAPSIKGNGEVNVKGGGGGGGAGGNNSGDGHPGYEPTNPLLDGLGGTDISTGGDGGRGGPRFVNLANDPSGENGFVGVGTNTGGGGGGGGGGVVVTTSTPASTLTGAN